jgi:hypothetical protein
MKPINPESLQLVAPVTKYTDNGLSYTFLDGCQVMKCPYYYKTIFVGCAHCVLFTDKNPKKYLIALLEGT